MGKFCQLVMGPAGSGKSTYCRTMLAHLHAAKRQGHLVNLDPAAEHFELAPTIDIRELITLDDVMDGLGHGPNGGLIYCLEYLLEQLDWLTEQIEMYEEDYLVIDCPGQIELYTHFPIMKRIVETLQQHGYTVCGVYCLDSQFMEDAHKFFAGVLAAMSAMIQLEIPHVNVMTKMDLVMADPDDGSAPDARDRLVDDGAVSYPARYERFFNVDPTLLLDDTNAAVRPKFRALNAALVDLIDEYSMVAFLPLNIRDETSVDIVLQHIDHAVQYGEDQEPIEPAFDDGGSASD